MDNKFKMELVWHNCKNYPPKEFSNNDLIATDGTNVFNMIWHREEGYFIETEWCSKRLDDLDNWYWADITQTVRGHWSKEQNE